MSPEAHIRAKQYHIVPDAAEFLSLRTMCKAAASRESQKNGVFRQLLDDYETAVELDDVSVTHGWNPYFNNSIFMHLRTVDQELRALPYIPSGPLKKGFQ